MILDEAIKHAEEVARQNEEDAIIYSNCKKHKKNLYEIGLAENAENKCYKCAKEHRQLAEWLKELKKYKEKDTPKLVIYSGDGYADGYIVYDFANCPNCDYEFEDGDDNWNSSYCCRCGQRLKWEEEE